MSSEHPAIYQNHAIDGLVNRIDHLFNLLMLQPAAGSDIVTEIESVVDLMIATTRANPDATIGIAHLRTDIKYSLIRAIQNTLFALLLSDEMESFDEARTHSLCCAALTEQISLYPLRDTLSRQQERLTAWQIEMIESYPQKAVKLLLSIGVTDPRWIQTIGTYSSDQLHLDELSSETAILSVVNRYGAMITERGSRRPMSSEKAIQSLLRENASRLEREIATQLLYLVGFYPPGTAVELESGEIAIVTHRGHHGQPLQLSSICDAEGERLQRPQPRDTRQTENQIRHSLYLDWVRHLNIELLWGEYSDSSAPLFQFNPHSETPA